MKQPFESLVEQHGATVLGVCRVVLGPHDADDAWSETFLSALRAYPDLPETANAQAWLVTIAQREVIDVLRTKKRSPPPVDEAPDAAAGPRVLDAGAAGLWATMRELPDQQRRAVAYRYVAGLAYTEIAEILGGTPEAARRAAADGLKHLRKHHPGALTKGAMP
ncbi:sigma-70 family RNA polymerase sigma factor [Streptomyces sp. NPDC093252]|uniref:RNA polymerase sigma factor n=1 Tax=Streptomyces sp. NPDC093252 TaxID=3154980 RepID=UPI0034287AC5